MENRGEEKSYEMEIVYLTYFNNFFTFTFFSSEKSSRSAPPLYLSHTPPNASYFDLEKKI